MPEWVTDLSKIGSVSSILGLFMTAFLFIEAKKIKNSFLRKARLPEINRELVKAKSRLSENLKDWGDNRTLALETFADIQALLESIKPRLPYKEKNKVDEYLSFLRPKRYRFLNRSLSELTDDEVWDRYTKLCGLVTSLQQLAKDFKWD